MDLSILANGMMKLVSVMEKESRYGQMDLYMKVIGKTIKQMEVVD